MNVCDTIKCQLTLPKREEGGNTFLEAHTQELDKGASYLGRLF